MAKSFTVDVVSPDARMWHGKATFLVAKTPEGEIGIMADHEPMMGALVTSAVTVEGVDGGQTIIAVHGGFIQVLANQVTLLTDRAQITEGSRADAVEAAEALAEAAGEAEAEEALASSAEPGVES